MKFRYLSVDLTPPQQVPTKKQTTLTRNLLVAAVLAIVAGLIYYEITGDPTVLKEVAEALRNAAIARLRAY